MRLLLDTHVLMWWAGGLRLEERATREIADADAEVFVSSISVWEAEVKTALGKLRLDGDLVQTVHEYGFTELPMTFAHGQTAGRLPLHHRDPFDRVLIAQAQLEQLVLVTRDAAFGAYDVALLAA